MPLNAMIEFKESPLYFRAEIPVFSLSRVQKIIEHNDNYEFMRKA